MTIETVLTCPLGSKCEEVRDGKVHRCAWFIQLAGRNPQTGEQVDERGCAMAWAPILLVENCQQSRHSTAAIESLRNESVEAQLASAAMLSKAVVQAGGQSLLSAA